ncbi:Insulysin, partial [Paragonimus kellicotti]
ANVSFLRSIISSERLEAEVLQQIPLGELLEFYDTYISPTSLKRKKVSVHVVSADRHGCNLKSLIPAVKGDMIRDHNKFKDGCKLSDLAQPFIPLKPRFNAEGASFLLPTQSSTSQP